MGTDAVCGKKHIIYYLPMLFADTVHKLTIKLEDVRNGVNQSFVLCDCRSYSMMCEVPKRTPEVFPWKLNKEEKSGFR